MTARYSFDPGQSRFTVQSFATGMLSMLGHSPTFAVRSFHGAVLREGQGAEGLVVEVTAEAGSLVLLDPVSAADREEIEGRMRRDVLETSSFPEVSFHTVEYEAEPAGPERFRLFLGGRLTLHGVTRAHGVDAELISQGGGLRLRGGCPLRMSAYRIRPVTALAGALKLRDELKVAFDLMALPEEPS